jgi:hypothetical protein
MRAQDRRAALSSAIMDPPSAGSLRVRRPSGHTGKAGVTVTSGPIRRARRPAAEGGGSGHLQRGVAASSGPLWAPRPLACGR